LPALALLPPTSFLQAAHPVAAVYDRRGLRRAESAVIDRRYSSGLPLAKVADATNVEITLYDPASNGVSHRLTG